MVTLEEKNLPKGWLLVKLGEVCKIQSGFAFKSEDYKHYGNPVIRISNIVNGTVELTEDTVYVSHHVVLGLDEFRIYPGELLIAMSGATTGKMGVVSNEIPSAYLNQRVGKFIPNPQKIESSYLRFFLAQPGYLEKILSNAFGSAIPNVSSSFIESLALPLPPIYEQKRIAAIAQKADRLRRTRRYALQLSDTFLQSVFLEMFGDPSKNPKGWDCTTIDNVVALSQYGTSEKSNYEKRGYPILGMGNITYSGHIDLNSVSYVELSKKEFSGLKLVPGDIIFNRTNSTELVGKTAHWNYNVDAVLASYLVKLKLKKEVLPDYFVALLNSNHFKQLFQERCKKAIGQSNISPTLLKEFPILVPPLPLQEKFAQIVQKFERLRTQQREAERQAEHLFQTILHRAFRGELTSSDINEEPASELLEQSPPKQTKPETTAKSGDTSTRDTAKNPDTFGKRQDTEAIQLKLPGFG
ncbi:restriction endonuclease subunit S [Laspinema sp. D1]|uniref:restriction endonuclease subunit S n=1 Tax=Laspinema palackyanum TaxID=3231601 RepID=UPI00346D80EF|nr:restriction endonuclease subunit S [Laspinema sp. D2b]